MEQNLRQILGMELFQASKTREVGAPLSERFPDITVEDAYYIQVHTLKQFAAQGNKVTGKKIGLTSKAMQSMFGVFEPDFGSLLDHLAFNSGDEIPAELLIQPKVEAEIAFVLQNDLTGKHITARDVLDATAYVTAAIEVVDSRIRNWQIKLSDTVGDNASFGAYVLGNTTSSVRDIDLRLVGMVLERNGVIANTGAGAAVMGHPANCVAWLANKMNEFNTPLRKGDVILSGAVTAAVEAKPGDYFRVQFDRLGEVCISFGVQK
ncbi:2-keto-4-pentenoate hydratase [Desulfitobacterium sp.]|uniref:2-keto-4-pentenoate hydratase n=1 Tax=Desulfitobacterium sp. TaxID=49981 RepID=UPI002C38C43D|nr:2-keto-4-pentenoate hydratase [Desulfitobacterium sp.]HVJ49615.1 2-keto-4-pentenoate hydratase [Desulfitobacterium sp.]